MRRRVVCCAARRTGAERRGLCAVQLLRMTGLLQLAGPEALREMQDAFAAGEGCRVHGTLPVPRVAGDFQLSINAQSLYMLRQVRVALTRTAAGGLC